MSAKGFLFTVEDARNRARTCVGATHESLAGAFALAAKELPGCFHDQAAGLRLFTFEFTNELTRESAGCIGQGDTVAAAFADAMKGTRETFNPKNDGKLRPAWGLPVRCAPRLGDPRAVCSIVPRSVEAFESDETIAEEAARRAREAEEKRLEDEGRAA